MKLAIISSLEHYAAAGELRCAPPAAVHEVDALASLFDEVVHVACLSGAPAPPQSVRYSARNVRLELLPLAGGRGVAGKLDALRALPGRVAAIERAWRDADAALVRCPSNVAAAALALASAGFGPRRVWIKYTGPWRGWQGEAPGYCLQRLWLRSGLTRAKITVGGVADDAGGGALTLCNPSLSLADAQAAELATRDKSLTDDWRLLAVGRLVRDKRFDIAIRSLALLVSKGCEARLDIAGDGPERFALAELAAHLGVANRVRFLGSLAEGDLDAAYRRAHVLVAPSLAEGWSRVWTEAAARRCVALVSNAGAAEGLEQAGAGRILSSHDPEVWACALARLLRDEPSWRRLAERGTHLARRFTYERFAEEARELLQLSGAAPEEALERA